MSIPCPACAGFSVDARDACTACGRAAPALVERLRAYVGPNWDAHYGESFRRLLVDGRGGPRVQWTWNWSAFLTPFWFLYRRLYASFAVLLLLHGLLWNLPAPDVIGIGDLGGIAALFLALVLAQGYGADRLLLRRARAAASRKGELGDPLRLAREGRPLRWVPWGAPAFVVLLLASLVIADELEQMPPLPQPDLNTVLGPDGLTEIVVPKTWEMMPFWDGSSRIRAGDRREEQYVVTASTPRGNLPGDETLDGRAQQALATARDQMRGATVKGPYAIRIHDNPAVQYELRGRRGTLDVAQWITVIETARYYHQVHAWAPLSRADSAEATLQNVTASFRERAQGLPAEAPGGP